MLEVETATKPSPAPHLKHWPGGCTIDMPPSNCNRRGEAYRFTSRYRVLTRKDEPCRGQRVLKGRTYHLCHLTSFHLTLLRRDWSQPRRSGSLHGARPSSPRVRPITAQLVQTRGISCICDFVCQTVGRCLSVPEL